MTPWILSICTAAWVLCGQYIEVAYPTEEACYKALDELHKRNPKGYKWTVCAPSQGVYGTTKRIK